MRSRRTPSSLLLLPVLGVALSPALVACGGDPDGDPGGDPEGASAPVPTVETVEEPVVDPVTAPVDPEPPVHEGPSGEDAVAFFRSTEADCAAFAMAVGNDVLPAYYFSDASAVLDLGHDSWVIADGAGVELVVDLSARVVHGLDGPSGVLPREYSFGCPEDLYLGSIS